MVSSLNVATSALVGLLFWTCIGAALTRRLAPGPLAWPLAPTVGWAVHSALALPLFRLVDLSPGSLLIVAVVSIGASVWSARRPLTADAHDPGARVPRWAYVAAALLAVAPALAVMPKEVGDGVILAGPIYDHSKVAMIDEMARLGVPPGNPFFGEGAAPTLLVYYYLWHFSAAELALACGLTGWEADIAMTFVAAFASLVLMMGLAVRFAGRGSAALWVVPLAVAGSLRPLLSLLFGADAVQAVLLPGTGFAGWIFQSAWVPQHLMSASCVVAAAVLMGRLGERGLLRVVVVALTVAASFESSTWIGGVTFALAALPIGASLLLDAEPEARTALALRLGFAAMVTAGVALPFLRDQLAVASGRDTGAPIMLMPYEVLGEAFPVTLRRALDVPAFWLVFLVVELPAIYLTGAVALAALLRRAGLDRAVRRETITVALLGAVGLIVSALLVSTLGGNDDLGWRAVLPAVLGLTACAAAGLAQWITARAWAPVAAALVMVALGLPRGVTIVRDNIAGRPQPQAAAFAQAPAMWDAIRRHSIADERVGNNPMYLAGVTPWPVNISWALLSDRRSCYAGREFATVFTAQPATRRDEIDALFTRVFAGEGSADDVRELATTYGCRAIALTAADGAWSHDTFASSPFYRMVESKPGQWRIYRAISPGDGELRP